MKKFEFSLQPESLVTVSATEFLWWWEWFYSEYAEYATSMGRFLAETRDVAKEATFKHLIQTGLHTGRKRIPSGVLILFSEYKLYSTYSVIFKLE